MEHRWNARTQVNAAITLNLPHSGAIQAIVKNISRSGMLLDTRQFDLMRGGVVELAYTVARKLEREIVRLKALIVHGGDGLAGIMFIAHPPHPGLLLHWRRRCPAGRLRRNSDPSHSAARGGDYSNGSAPSS